jgi:uncharacterized ion transporter superfamily protein YfcC
MGKNKKQINFPDTLIILSGILVVFMILTWFVSAGEFDRVVQNGRTIIVPGTYQSVESNPQGVGALLMAPIKGFIGAAQIIAFVFLIGGAFGMINRTGAMDAGIRSILKISQENHSFKKWVIPALMTLFSLAGATFGMSEEVLVFVMISIPLGMALGYDSIVGIAIPFVGAGAGFAGAFLNPFTVGVAQGIAELTPFSGMGYRLIAWFIMTCIAILFVVQYAQKLDKKAEASPVFEIDQQREFHQLSEQQLSFNWSHRSVLLLFIASLILLVVGVSFWDWYINEITALFLALGIASAMVGKIGSSSALSAFKDGAREMLVPALVIALANGLIVVVQDGKIIDTILHSMASLVDDLPRPISVEFMFVFQSLLNFFIPSGSGQAALTMPLMAPLSDILEIDRQIAVLAYQFGDGLSNMIIPTSGVTMGVLAIAKIPYNLWLKWMFPLFIYMSLAAMAMLFLAVLFING